MTGLMPYNPTSYVGQIAVPFINETFPPNTSNINFNVPTLWMDTDHENAYILVSKALGIATWVLIGGSPGEIDTITTPDGTVVVPTAGNINFLNGTGMNITGAGSNITFNSAGGGLNWVDVITTSQAMAINTAYGADNSSLVTLTLPIASVAGSVIEVYYKGTGGWLIAQNASQQIKFGSIATTVGIGGSIASMSAGDTIKIRCITVDILWEVLGVQGNLLVT